jgi:hypothetical protein
VENLKINVRSPNVLFNRLIREPLEAIIQKNPAKKIVFLIDALDESITRFDDTSIISFTNIDTLSSNVRFILTTRDNEEIIALFSGDGKIISLSGQYYENNKNDIFEYVNLRISKDQVLQHHYNGFIDDLNLKAEGNFLYVTFLLDAIVEGKLELTKENLDKVPPFLDGLYYEFLNRLKLKDERRWEKKLKPILYILSISFTGFNESELSFLCSLYPSEVSDCLSELTPFIKPLENNDDSNSNRYKLYHQSLIDFFRREKYLTKNKEGQDYSQKNHFFMMEEESHQRIIDRYYDENNDEFKINLLKEYGLRYLPEHLFALIDHNNPKGIDWYAKLLHLAKNEEFEQKQLECFAFESDLPLKTIKIAFESSLMKKDPVSTVEMLLIYANRAKKVFQKSPLSILEDIDVDVDKYNNEINDVLELAWRIADSYDKDGCITWYLLISWSLDYKNKTSEAKETLDRLFKKEIVYITEGNDAINFLIYSLYERHKETIAKIFDCLSNDDIYNICKLFIENKKGIIGIEVFKYIKSKSTEINEKIKYSENNKSEANPLDNQLIYEIIEKSNSLSSSFRSQALSSIASALAQSGKISEAIDFAKAVGDSSDRSQAISSIASALAQSGKISEAIDAAKAVGDSVDISEAI